MYDNVLSVLHNRWIQSLGVLLVLVLAGVLFYFISPLLIPLFLAMLVAYLLFPLVVFLERHGMRRSVTASALAVLSLLVLIMIPLFIVPRLVNETDQLIRSARQTVARELRSPQGAEAETWLDRTLDWLPLQEFVTIMGWWKPEEVEQAVPEVEVTPAPETTEVSPEPALEPAPETVAPTTEQTNEEAPTAEATVPPATPELSDELARAIVAEHVFTSVRENIQGLTRRYAVQATGAIRTGTNTLGDLLHYLWQIIVKLLAFLVNFSVFAFATGYLLVSFDRLVERVRELIPLRYREHALSTLRKVDFQMRSFVRGQVLVATINAIVYSIGLTISGVPFGAFIGLLTGFLSFIPYLGVLLGLIPSVTLVLVQYGFDWHIVGVLVTFALVQSQEEVILRPLILGDKIGLHPVWVMAAFLVFGHAFGFLGVLLAVPMAAILKVFVVEIYEYYRSSTLYDDRNRSTEEKSL